MAWPSLQGRRGQGPLGPQPVRQLAEGVSLGVVQGAARLEVKGVDLAAVGQNQRRHLAKVVLRADMQKCVSVLVPQSARANLALFQHILHDFHSIMTHFAEEGSHQFAVFLLNLSAVLLSALCGRFVAVVVGTLDERKFRFSVVEEAVGG